MVLFRCPLAIRAAAWQNFLARLPAGEGAVWVGAACFLRALAPSLTPLRRPLDFGLKRSGAPNSLLCIDLQKM